MRIVAAFLCILCVGARSSWLAAQEPAPRPPHVVVLLSDDAGYADFSMHGATDLATPRIDQIAQQGVRCSDGYVSGSVCSPTRAGLMTGRYQQRFGHEFNIPPALSESNGLPVAERTIADRLRAVGYRTVGLGKWHLGYADHFHPLARGFDDWFGFLQGSRSYFPLPSPTRLNRLQRGREAIPETFDYMTDELARQARKAIEQRGDQPLFLYVAFHAVHGPMHALEQDLVGAEGTERRRKLIAMTRALDRAVGVILDALAAEGIADNTLLFFLNDNGGATNNASRNAPLRGHKGQLWEGGIRVPFLVRWPAELPAGAVVREPVIALDILPTALAAAGRPAAADVGLDGMDLLPVLRGKAGLLRALHWRQGADTFAVRQGDWKLVRQGKDAAPMLFQLRQDLGEADDLAAKEPERAEQMLALHAAWSAQLAEPRWGAKAADEPADAGGK